MSYAKFALLGITTTAEPVTICTEPGCGCLMRAQAQPMRTRTLWQLDCISDPCPNKLHTAYITSEDLLDMPTIADLSKFPQPTFTPPCKQEL